MIDGMRKLVLSLIEGGNVDIFIMCLKRKNKPKNPEQENKKQDRLLLESPSSVHSFKEANNKRK